METRCGGKALELETGDNWDSSWARQQSLKQSSDNWAGTEEIALKDGEELKSVRLRDQLYLVRTWKREESRVIPRFLPGQHYSIVGAHSTEYFNCARQLAAFTFITLSNTQTKTATRPSLLSRKVEFKDSK